jgi:hypothetical protein
MPENMNEADAVVLTEDSSLADVLRAIIALEDGKTVKVLKCPNLKSKKKED